MYMHAGMITCTSLGVIKTSVSFGICIHPPHVQAKAQCMHIFRTENNFILQLRPVDHLKQQARTRKSRAVGVNGTSNSSNGALPQRCSVGEWRVLCSNKNLGPRGPEDKIGKIKGNGSNVAGERDCKESR